MIIPNTIYKGNALDILKSFPDECINTTITSPPYWSLRNYPNTEQLWGGKNECQHEFIKQDRKLHGGTITDEYKKTISKGINTQWTTTDKYCSKCGAWFGQLGLEPTIKEYVNHLCDIFDEVKRVTKKEGSCWINIADTYYTISGGKFLNDNIGKKNNNSGLSQGNSLKKQTELPQKSLCNIPARFSIEMQNRGWILRNSVVWHKPSCLPSSVKDRLTVDYENLFFFVKSPKYYFEQQFEPFSEAYKKDKRPINILRQQLYKNSKYHNSEVESTNRQGLHKLRGQNLIKKRTKLPDKTIFVEWLKKNLPIDILSNVTTINKTTLEHWYRLDGGFSYPSIDDWQQVCEYYAVKPFPELLEYVLELDVIKSNPVGRNKRCVWSINPARSKEQHYAPYPEELVKTPLLATCPIGGIVLDPFFGTGTTGVVARKNHRNYIGIDANQDYINIAEKRLYDLNKQRILLCNR